MADLRDIKTDEYTINSGHLDVGGGHKVYFEQWGNTSADVPIIFFHGGPGSSYKSKYKAGFDPKRHQVVFFDQRGSGNSLPYGGINNNTTQDLISDAKAILDKLEIKNVYVYGGSWGSALALLFSINYPAQTVATIVYGVFTARQSEIDHIDKGMFVKFYPEVWEKFVASVPVKYKSDPAIFHYKNLATEDKQKISKSSKALSELELPLLFFDWSGYGPDYKTDKPDDEEFDPVPYRIYAHYLTNGCFMKGNHILDLANKIKSPLYIVQGRYDMCCPPVTAIAISKIVRSSKLYMTLGGHSGSDPNNRTILKALADTVFI